MADYVAVVRRAVDSLDDNTAENRALIYDKARTALGRQLDGMADRLSADQIAAQKASLEDAFTTLEAEFAPAPELPSEPEPDQMVFEAADMERAEADYSAAAPVPEETDAPALAEPAPEMDEDDRFVPRTEPDDLGMSTDSAASTRDRLSSAFQSGESEYLSRHGRTESQDGTVSGQSLDSAEPSNTLDVSAGGEPSLAPSMPEGASLSAPAAEAVEIPGDDNRSKAWVIWLAVFAVAIAAGAYGYANRETVLPQIERLTERVRAMDDDTPVEQPKIEDRVPVEGQPPAEAAAPETEPEPAAETETATAPVEPEFAPTQSPTIDVVAPPAEIDRVVPEGDSPEERLATVANTPPPVGDRAILYDERTGPEGTDLAQPGAVRWSTVTETGEDGAAAAVLTGKAEIPQRGFSLDFTIRKNNDDALPATHTVELIFALSEGSEGEQVANIGGLLMKASEPERGEPLRGAAARVTDGFFIIGLSSEDSDVPVNERLLREREWIDIPILYASGKRGIVTLHRGAEGSAAFTEALDAWAQ